MLPTQERLEAADMICAQVDDWLKGELKLGGCNGFHQGTLERLSGEETLLHDGLKEAIRAASFRLGLVQSNVGFPEQVGRVDAISRRQRDTDAHARPDEFTVHLIRSTQPLDDPAG